MEFYKNNEQKRQLTLTNSIQETLAIINYDEKGNVTFSKEWAKNCLTDLKSFFKNVLA